MTGRAKELELAPAPSEKIKPLAIGKAQVVVAAAVWGAQVQLEGGTSPALATAATEATDNYRPKLTSPGGS